MSDPDALNHRAMRRVEEAGKRADDLGRRYQQLANDPGATAGQVQHARRAAIAARSCSAQAWQSLLEQLDRSAAIHQRTADAHDQAAAAAKTPAEMFGHMRAADKHLAAAHREHAMVARLRERQSPNITGAAQADAS